MKTDWIAIDWGTTNFRAFLITAQGEIIDKVTAKRGLMSVESDKYPSVLQELIQPWSAYLANNPIFMAGMVGSKQGWKNVPYLNLPAGGDDLVAGLYQINLPWGNKGYIVPGLTVKNEQRLPDVMRGEEVQLLGLAEIIQHKLFSAILPGTHSKHACWYNGKLIKFSTYMTGELFSTLRHHTILGHSLCQQTFDQQFFLLGVSRSQMSELSHLLFSVRTCRLFADVPESAIESYLSGILIGNELRQLQTEQPIYLIGEQTLSHYYALALNALNKKSQLVNAERCFLVGMLKIYRGYNETRPIIE